MNHGKMESTGAPIIRHNLQTFTRWKEGVQPELNSMMLKTNGTPKAIIWMFHLAPAKRAFAVVRHLCTRMDNPKYPTQIAGSNALSFNASLAQASGKRHSRMAIGPPIASFANEFCKVGGTLIFDYSKGTNRYIEGTPP